MRLLLFIQNLLKNISQVVESVLRILLFSKFRQTIRASTLSKCVILGNGPSLTRDIDSFPEFLLGKEIVCVNHFPSSDLYEKIQPGTYITSAPDLWLDEIDERFVSNSKRMFDNLFTKTTWPIDLYIPYEAAKHARWQKQIIGNKNITICYYNNIPIEGWEWFTNFSFTMRWGMPRPHNVMIPSLMICLWKKYNQIYLLGADHSWLSEITVSDDNEVLIKQKHFYDENTAKGMPLDKRGVGKRNLSELLHKFTTAFASYFIIRKYSEHLNAEILNATKGSFIDAFKRFNLNKQRK